MKPLLKLFKNLQPNCELNNGYGQNLRSEINRQLKQVIKLVTCLYESILGGVLGFGQSSLALILAIVRMAAFCEIRKLIAKHSDDERIRFY